MWQMPYSPWPPDCLTLRPSPLALPPSVSRSGTRSGMRLHGHPVAAAQPVQQQVGVGLAHAPQHQLAGLGVVLQPEGRVLGHQPAQGLRPSCPRLALDLAADRDRAAAARAVPGLHQQRPVLARTACRRSRPCQLGHRADVSGQALGHGALLLAQRRGQRPDPLVGVVVGVPALRPGRARTRARRRPAAACPENTRTRLIRPT